MVAYNSFATWRNEEAFCQVRSGFEEAEAAAIQAFIETAQREEHARALMDAERQIYEQLNANAASGEQQTLIAQREDESASFMAAQSAAHEEFNAARARREALQAHRARVEDAEALQRLFTRSRARNDRRGRVPDCCAEIRAT